MQWVRESLGEVQVSYKAQSYVGVRVGRRTWAPLWLRQDGAMVYLPDPDGTRSDTPSLAFEHFEERLQVEGLDELAAVLQRKGQPGGHPPACGGSAEVSRTGSPASEL